MITDGSGLSVVGLALLRRNKDKLLPPVSLELKVMGGKQVMLLTGTTDSFWSSSFGWGRADERSQALFTALDELGCPMPLEQIQLLDPDGDHTFRGARWATQD
ncbi:hypothetical protein LCGC14_1457100 [marine sediment metagenome]|uniref:Uncharacterized protein n=1 Tax=marine sediment metagenome TaxID=412755 RepID=A0A0F9MI55_9ZZZZ